MMVLTDTGSGDELFPGLSTRTPPYTQDSSGRDASEPIDVDDDSDTEDRLSMRAFKSVMLGDRGKRARLQE